MRRGLSEWHYHVLGISVVLAAGGYLAGVLWSGWSDVTGAMARVGIGGLVFALLMSLLNYSIRFMRWSRYLKLMGYELPWAEHLRIYLGGFALTTTPGKAGEALRGVLLKPWGVGYPQSFAALVSERISDLISVVLLTLAGLASHPDAKGVVLGGGIMILAFMLLLYQENIVLQIADKVGRVSRQMAHVLRHVASLLSEIRRCHGPGLFTVALALGVLAWFAEAYAFYWILVLLKPGITLSFATFVYALSMLTGAVSLLPGGLGSAEAVMVSLLAWKGFSIPDAVAATVLIRTATLWFAVFLGLVSLLVRVHGGVRR